MLMKQLRLFIKPNNRQMKVAYFFHHCQLSAAKGPHLRLITYCTVFSLTSKPSVRYPFRTSVIIPIFSWKLGKQRGGTQF